LWYIRPFIIINFINVCEKKTVVGLFEIGSWGVLLVALSTRDIKPSGMILGKFEERLILSFDESGAIEDVGICKVEPI
jgi:hypothetical protein